MLSNSQYLSSIYGRLGTPAPGETVFNDLGQVLALLNQIKTAQNQQATLVNQLQELGLLNQILQKLTAVPSRGKFNPPSNLVKSKPVEVIMSVLELEVGQTAGPQMMTFDEPDAPADGAVSSDNPAVATISLDSTDHRSWTVHALSVGVANMSYTGTSASPDVGPAVVPNMVVTVVAVPVAEHGDFNPAGAPISGP